MTAPYAELVAATNYSFLRGASHASDLVARALELDHAGIGIADRNSVAGVVRAYAALEHGRRQLREALGEGAELPFRLAVGARLAFADGAPDIVAYPETRDGWARLCRLLTLGKLRAPKGECTLALDDLLVDARDLLLIVMPGRRLDDPALLRRIADGAPGAAWLGAAMHRRGDDRRRLARLRDAGAACGLPLLATNDVLYDTPDQRDLQDVLTCIREGVRIDEAGRRLEANAERHLKAPAEMARLFRDAPEAITETQHLLGRVGFSLGELRYEYPDEPVPPGWTPQGWLADLTWRRAAYRYPDGVPGKVERVLHEELALIATLDYARYFLTIHDIVRFAEDKGILCQGRGSAANSAVCFVLGITAVDPTEHDLLFARFISSERSEPPDIDVDFEHERREEVIQHIYARYGRDRAGIAATVISYRPRSAIRDVGKALGLTEDVTAKLAGTVWGSWGRGISDSQIREAGLDPANPMIRRAVDLAIRLLGFPRHLSQHVGGFVLARGRLDDIVPIANAAMAERTFIEWDKDDIDTLKLMKVDVLALGMLTCIRKSFDLLRRHVGEDRDLTNLPKADEPRVYEMLQRGDSIGVFQVESRAQINMLPRMKPENFYDLAIEVAIVRPGPIQGNMVHPYLRRRQKLEPVVLPSPSPEHGPANELHEILGRTLGVPLFQEQAMKLAMVAAQFTAEEANGLRRAMATFRHVGTIGTFEDKMVGRMVARGYDRDFAERCFAQIKGFGTYGFPESHAASFAKLVYVSSWIKCLHPAVFACALLNSQPMGFYAPAQIVRDAREHGVEVREVDVNASAFDNSLEAAEDGVPGSPIGPHAAAPSPGWERDGVREVPHPERTFPSPCPSPFGRGDPCPAGTVPLLQRGSAHALRIGFRQIDGFREDWATAIVAARGSGYATVEDLAARTRLPNRALARLAEADAMRSMGLDRREAGWAVRRLPDDAPLPLFAAADARDLGAEADARLPVMPLSEQVALDYRNLRLSLKAHPMAFLRPTFAAERVVACGDLQAQPDAAWLRTAGIVLVRQRPGNGNAIFITLEDESGIANVLLWARIFERYRRAVMSARLLLVEGRVQKSPEGVVHIMGEHVLDRSAELRRLMGDDAGWTPPSRADPGYDVRAGPPDELTDPRYPPGSHHPRDVRLLPRSRDFH